MTPSRETSRDSKYSPRDVAKSIVHFAPDKDDEVQELPLKYIVGCLKGIYLSLDRSGREADIDRDDGR
jgi:hypothetical protein